MMTVDQGLAKIKENQEIKVLWENCRIKLQNKENVTIGMMTAFLCTERTNIIELLGRDSYLELLKEFASKTPEKEMINMLGVPGKGGNVVEHALYFAVHYGAYNLLKESEADSGMLQIIVAHTPEVVFDASKRFNKNGYSIRETVLSAVITYKFDKEVVSEVVAKTSNLEILEKAKGIGSEAIDNMIDQRIKVLSKGSVWSMFNVFKKKKPNKLPAADVKALAPV